ncbi:dhhc zinc finger domain containing protein [Stylonychia lemnae]|uniref:Dhhc zinc finger domain containing protein n=1 Tax=Stylonychia lemnae TaxID=5949 RepID=A0A078AYG1_STYLE|nr:dhhc zinc finger domain containing protein [Stylonychia lemnae]|eukprot:CDW85828.1 dhhc zinc finger domain containing protein [Stylonychia lemnae]
MSTSKNIQEPLLTDQDNNKARTSSIVEFLQPSESEINSQSHTFRMNDPQSKVDQKTQPFETFDSSMDDRREEKLVFKFIQRGVISDLKDHIYTCKDRIDICKIYDRQGYSPLHFAAYKNSDKMCEILCEFVKFKISENLSKIIDDSLQSEYPYKDRLKYWINTHSKGEEGFTALHFASFHGNIRLIKYLLENGADPSQSNKQGINMLHVAAQGDQPASLYFFKQLGIDIDSRDKRQSTPLHWAAFSGAELALSYIVAWNPDINAVDSKGLTALHLAVKSSEDLRSTKAIKQLLIKGAEKNIKDIQGHRAIDLKDQGSSLGDCLMIKTQFKKHHRSLNTLIFYFMIMLISFLLIIFFIFPTLDDSHNALKYSVISLFGLTMLLWLFAWLLDPGFQQKDKNLDFNMLLDNFEANCLCPECEVIRTPRSRHCNELFNVLLLCCFLICLLSISSMAYSYMQILSNFINLVELSIDVNEIQDQQKQEETQTAKIIQRISCFLITALSVAFFIPLLNNSLTNYMESPRRKMSVLFLEQDYSNNCIGNCFKMICENRIDTQSEIMAKTSAIYSNRKIHDI